jgi:hypothetical protein
VGCNTSSEYLYLEAAADAGGIASLLPLNLRNSDFTLDAGPLTVYESLSYMYLVARKLYSDMAASPTPVSSLGGLNVGNDRQPFLQFSLNAVYPPLTYIQFILGKFRV